jgi:hypothetical protein
VLTCTVLTCAVLTCTVLTCTVLTCAAPLRVTLARNVILVTVHLVDRTP